MAKMKLWEVSNGYMGEGFIRVLVIASTKNKAKVLGSKKLKEFARNKDYDKQLKYYSDKKWNTSMLKEFKYKSNYWEFDFLSADCICPDLTEEWSGEVEGE